MMMPKKQKMHQVETKQLFWQRGLNLPHSSHDEAHETSEETSSETTEEAKAGDENGEKTKIPEEEPKTAFQKAKVRMGFVCFGVINPRVLLANRVDLGFFLFHKFSHFTPPPPSRPS